MSERPAKRIMDGLKELHRFMGGEPGLLTVSVPDGAGGVKRRLVHNVDELVAAHKQQPANKDTSHDG